ncbi:MULTISPECIES: hypothetical protein [Methylobacterium]|uniref:Cupin domain-containing protein n=1 Tax=Methylobacterium thuringiense TaxID=1003091 RepID=A0ABQ4TQP4_9HYPH|nr:MULTISPECIES: hypothetical protein [Methylobacterium]GJE56437.1 hypothetical protein EKPJFOCH_2941 [Methylobacterium thuringiense]
MAGLSIVIAFSVRLLLVALFLPFSALDKIVNFRGAVGQASQITASKALATGLILAGLTVEIVMSLGILTGIADRAAGFVLAGYCGVTALLWKQFWKPGDFWAGGKGRELFWDFLKNFALAGGFLLVTFGTTAGSVGAFFADPFASSRPYDSQRTQQTGRTVSDQDKPNIPYWHLWTDRDGVSRHTRCVMTEFDKKSMSPPASPQWQGQKTHDGATVFVTVQPVGWTGDWHENPKPQWIIPLSGRWFVEAMDGSRVEMGPGEISFGEDQNTKERDGRKGHYSGTVGDEPAVLMIVQYDKPPTIDAACRFK